MKKFYLILLLLITSSCTLNLKKNNLDEINFSDEMNFNELKKNLDLYSEISAYPKLNE